MGSHAAFDLLVDIVCARIASTREAEIAYAKHSGLIDSDASVDSDLAEDDCDDRLSIVVDRETVAILLCSFIVFLS